VRTYLYGLILSRNAHLVPPHITGIRGARVAVLPCEGLCALVSAVESASSNDLDALRAHDHAMQSVVHHGATASAVRFGQTFADDVELRRHLASRCADLTATLEELDGCVEMRLLMTLPEELPAEKTDLSPGRAYLESLRGSNRVSGLAIRAAIGPMVRAERVEELRGGAGVAFAHLIRRADEQQYRDAVASQPAFAQATVVGPLALYAFAEGAS
jgi:hypothetical protein